MVLDHPVESQWDFATSASISPESATQRKVPCSNKRKLGLGLYERGNAYSSNYKGQEQ